MVVALDYNIPPLTYKIFDFLRKFYKVKPGFVFACVFGDGNCTVEYNRKSYSLWSATNLTSFGKSSLNLPV